MSATSSSGNSATRGDGATTPLWWTRWIIGGDDQADSVGEGSGTTRVGARRNAARAGREDSAAAPLEQTHTRVSKLIRT